MVTEINDEGLKLQKKILMNSNNLHLAFPFQQLCFCYLHFFGHYLLYEPFPPIEW